MPEKIDVVLGSNDRKSHAVSGDEEVHYSRFLMFVSLRQNGKLAKPGTQRAMLFSPREDDKLEEKPRKAGDEPHCES